MKQLVTTEWLEKNIDKINWHTILANPNPNIEKIIEENLDNVMNTNNTPMNQEDYEKRMWYYLSQHPNLMNMLERNQDKIDYKKAGVIVTSLVPNNSYQLGIFENEDYRHKPLMKTMDYINSKYGEKIKLANQDLKRKWKMKQEFLSPCYTTKIDDIIRIK